LLSAIKMKLFYFVLINIFIFCFFLSFVFASDQEFIITTTGDKELYAVSQGDVEFNVIFSDVNETVTQTVISQGGSSNIKKIRYDVSVTTNKDKYYTDEVIEATIKLINTGNNKDEDAILTYYLKSPQLIDYDKGKENILDIPSKNSNFFVCLLYGGSMQDGDCVKIIKKTLALPINANIGEWSFNIEYKSPEQELIHSYDSFEVMPLVTSSGSDYESYSYNKNDSLKEHSTNNLTGLESNNLEVESKNETKLLDFEIDTPNNNLLIIISILAGLVALFAIIFFVTRGETSK